MSFPCYFHYTWARLGGRLWVKRERCHSRSSVIENIHEHCIGSQNERGIYAAPHHYAGTPAPNAFLRFILGTTTIWAGVEACCPLNPLPPCKAKSRPFACACALSALVCPAHASLPSGQPLWICFYKLTSLLFVRYDGNTPTSELCMCCLFGIACSSGFLSLPLLEASVLYWNAFFSTLPKPRLFLSSPTLLLAPHIWCAMLGFLICFHLTGHKLHENWVSLSVPCSHLAHKREMPTSGNWKEGSAVTNAWCFCRVPGFGA